MVSLADLTERFTREHPQPEYREALLAGLPTSLFGKAVADHIEAVRLEGKTLIMKVPDSAWRKELAKHKIRLLVKAREVYPGIRDLTLEG